MSIQIQTLKGETLHPFVNELAHLRMTVFRDYPYLYDGDREYEMGYLRRFIESPNSVMVIAQNEQKQIVGASTACPMKDELPETKAPFLKNHYNVDEIYYFSESVLLPEYRGKGVGKLFFEAREEMARAFGGIQYLAFCAVEREANHSAKTSNYRSPETIWTKQGFVKHPELFTFYEWKEINHSEKTDHKMTFWLKAL